MALAASAMCAAAFVSGGFSAPFVFAVGIVSSAVFGSLSCLFLRSGGSEMSDESDDEVVLWSPRILITGLSLKQAAIYALNQGYRE